MLVDFFDEPLQFLHVFPQEAKEIELMFGQGAEQRIVHRLLFRFEPAAQAFIQLVLVHVSLLEQPGKDVSSGNAEEIREDGAQFDIGRLQHFLNPVFL
ncbi:hypothetical protein Gste01_01980 [Geobacillus stearothermophilus ATCC 7953]